MSNAIVNRIKNSLTPQLKEKLFFLHVPKCGGNSIKDALRASIVDLNYRNDDKYVYLNNSAIEGIVEQFAQEQSEELKLPQDSYYRIPEALLLYHMYKSKTQCIAGHIPYSKLAYEKFGDKYAFITLLRNPVERWISEYFYNRQSGRANASMSIEEYAVSERGLVQGTEYVLFMGGRANQNDHISNKAIKRAVSNLDNFRLIGFVEDMQGFADRFAQEFGPTLNIGRENVTTANEGRDSISAELMTQIENICEPDLEIYQRAKAIMA